MKLHPSEHLEEQIQVLKTTLPVFDKVIEVLNKGDNATYGETLDAMAELKAIKEAIKDLNE